MNKLTREEMDLILIFLAGVQVGVMLMCVMDMIIN